MFTSVISGAFVANDSYKASFRDDFMRISTKMVAASLSITLEVVSFTVVPLHNLDIPAGSRMPFGSTFVLQDVPEWLKKDTGFLNGIAHHDRVATLHAKHALVSEYEANSIGCVDPDWKGKEPRGIQDLRFQSAILANMAM